MTSTYDRIARFYDVDMAQNMRFDDVAFYAHQCERSRGAILELGCGNGRILLPLLARGFDAVGVDASAPMLAEMKRKARMQSLPMRGVCADVRRLPLRRGFATILCPYSLVTYMTTEDDAKAMIEGARALLVPRAVEAQAEFQADYRRPFGAFTLARSKRIQPLPDGTNRIERRYELVANGRVADTIEVSEIIRPCTPEMLRAAVADAGLAPVTEAWDYGTRPDAEGAQFFTVVARAKAAQD